jgi:hypothetical protein
MEKETNKEIPSKQELDAFRMKVITLLRHHPMHFISFSERLHMIREVPINMKESSTLSKALDCIIAMHQTISTFPGETIELKGSFKRYPQSHCRSIPIPESFQLETQSRQIGFPHPSQHNGWALSDIWLPNDDSLSKKRDKIALQLMPEGRFNLKAKELLKYKHQCFNSHAQEFLALHHQLYCNLLHPLNPTAEKILGAFFDSLSRQKNIYNHLSTIQQQILDSAAFTASQADLDFIQLMRQSYVEIAQTKREMMEKLALKQLREFIFELETLEINSSQEIYSWLRDMLQGDINTSH